MAVAAKTAKTTKTSSEGWAGSLRRTRALRRARTSGRAGAEAHPRQDDHRGAAAVSAAGSGSPGSAAPAGAAENKEQDQKNDHQGNQSPERSPVPLLIRFILRGVRFLIRAAVNTLHPVVNLFKGQLYRLVVVRHGKGGLHIGIQNGLDRPAFHGILQPGSLQHVVILFPDHQQDQHAVVALFAADAPLIKEGIGIVVDGLPVEEIHGHHTDLGPRLLIQGLVLPDN